MTLTRRIADLGVIAAMAAGCSFLSPGLQPSGKPGTGAGESGRAMTVKVAVRVHPASEYRIASDRLVLYNGPGGAMYNDIAHLVVGLFDYGATSVPSLGYLFAGDLEEAGRAELSATAAGAGGTAAYVAGTAVPITAKIGTVNCSSCDFAAVPATDANKDLRRYMIRDYKAGNNWLSAATQAQFSNVPLADSGGSHRYVVFAAAYADDAAGPQLLGYTEAKLNDGAKELPDANTADVPLTGTMALDLKLDEKVLTKDLTEAPTLSVYVPGARQEAWDATREFSLTSNPSGAWTYGWKGSTSGSATFTKYLQTRTADGVNGWYKAGSSDYTPWAARNDSGSAVYSGDFTPGRIAFHPSPEAYPSVIRWTAPRSMRVRVSGSFMAGDAGVMTYTIQHQYSAGATNFFVSAANPGTAPFDVTRDVAAGDKLDFMVSGAYGSGTTPIDILITQK